MREPSFPQFVAITAGLGLAAWAFAAAVTWLAMELYHYLNP